ncbi:MAG TPA: beta-galactosidase trimerization domain-containing protein [Planctomycetota bacterium]|nr:beta-galactosidase trimerization domain-containing protein [Planctomycetota bacterium]
MLRREFDRCVMILGVFAAMMLAGRAAAKTVPWNEIHATLNDLDQCRALSMRALRNAQDFKTLSLYGRGWGLDMPEGPAEDVLIEGLWLYDHLEAMDTSSMSLVSYATAENHPNVQAELRAMQAFLPEAARQTQAYFDRTANAMADAREQVNAAARAHGPLDVRTIPAQPWPGVPNDIMAAGGDGFTIGWAVPVVPEGAFAATVDAFQYGREYMLQKAREAGLDFIRPWDTNTFNWADIETSEGRYDWTRVDEACRRLAKYGLAMWMRIPSSIESPPQWLLDRLGDQAVLLGPDGKRIELPFRIEDGYMFGLQDTRPKKYPINMFNPEVTKAYCAWLSALVKRVQENKTRVYIAELLGGGDRGGALPYYGGPQATQRFREWLKKNNVDPKTRWGTDVAVDAVELPWTLVDEKAGRYDFVTIGVADPGGKRMLIDFNRWREQEYIDYFRPQVEAIRAVQPGLPICTTSTDYGEWNMALAGRDDPRLIRELGLVPCGFSMENIWDRLRRTYGPAHFGVGPTHSGAGDAYSQYALSGYMNGTFGLYSLTHVRGFYWGDSIFYPDLRWGWTSLFGWRRFHERAQGMAPEMLNTAPAPQVALLWSSTSGEYQSFIRDYVGGTYGFRFGPANYNKIGCVGWSRILDSVCLDHNVVTEDQVRADALGGYQMLIMPAVQALPADVAEKIRQYVSAGGIVVATSSIAEFDQEMEQQGAGQLADVFGADFDQFLAETVVADSPMTVPVEDVFRSVWSKKEHTGTDQLKTLFCTYKPRQGAEVIESFTDGRPAVILNTFGKGKAMAIGYPVGKQSFLSDVYHHHYGNNWQNIPHGSRFQQGLFNWFEQQFQRLGFVRNTQAVKEFVGRITGEDAAWPSRLWPRAFQEYRDYTWKHAVPRAVEMSIRTREGNPNRYLSLFNREGSYGFEPGVIEFEAVSKQVELKVKADGAKFVYDLTLGCAVPVQAGEWLAFQTLLEPSSARMLVLSSDGTFSAYAGNRVPGGRSDEDLRTAVNAVAGRKGTPPDDAVIGSDDIVAFLKERGPKGIVISCEQQAWMPAARTLADAIQKAFGVSATASVARVTRTSPRIGGQHSFLWSVGSPATSVDEPDIILGNRDESHFVARFGSHTGGMGNHTAPLPFMTSRTFPGDGRAIICLTRPFAKEWSTPPRAQADPAAKMVTEKPARQSLVVGASDPAGVIAGVQRLIQLVKKAR